MVMRQIVKNLENSVVVPELFLAKQRVLWSFDEALVNRTTQEICLSSL